MSKTFIRTSDVFNIKNKSVNETYFAYCLRKAIKYGLKCVPNSKDEGIIELKLSGSKKQFVKYYLTTMFKTTNKIDGIKRLISIICT